MPHRNKPELRVRGVRKDKPDLRALARVLIELAIAEMAEEAKTAGSAGGQPGGDTATKESA